MMSDPKKKKEKKKRMLQTKYIHPSSIGIMLRTLSSSTSFLNRQHIMVVSWSPPSGKLQFKPNTTIKIL
jgi:hypothetical protein